MELITSISIDIIVALLSAFIFSILVYVYKSKIILSIKILYKKLTGEIIMFNSTQIVRYNTDAYKEFKNLNLNNIIKKSCNEENNMKIKSVGENYAIFEIENENCTFNVRVNITPYPIEKPINKNDYITEIKVKTNSPIHTQINKISPILQYGEISKKLIKNIESELVQKNVEKHNDLINFEFKTISPINKKRLNKYELNISKIKKQNYVRGHVNNYSNINEILTSSFKI